MVGVLVGGKRALGRLGAHRLKLDSRHLALRKVYMLIRLAQLADLIGALIQGSLSAC